MTTDVLHEQMKAFLLEFLKSKREGQYHDVVAGVIGIAIRVGALVPTKPDVGRGNLERVGHEDREAVGEHVRELMWELLVQGIIVFGISDGAPGWPWYRVTRYGAAVVDGQGPQPYDPNGFMREFRRVNPTADPVIIDYLEEALRAFHHGCQKSTSVMIGAASEQAILLLHEAFGNAIVDPVKKAAYEKKSGDKMIHGKYKVLKANLDLLVASKTLRGELADIVSGHLTGAFDLIRRWRNASGHPELVQKIDPDTNFLTLRVFTEYVRSVYLLIDYCKTSAIHL
jgi:hypothetical protein